MNSAIVPIESKPRAVGPGATSLRRMQWPGIREGASEAANPVAILLHGFGHSADIWRASVAFWRNAAQTPTILAFDLPGHGRSGTLPPDRYCVDEIADRLAREIHSFVDQPVVLIGHSVGGRVALALSEKRSILIDGVILVETGVGGVPASSQAAIVEAAKAMSSTFSSKAELIEQIMRQTPLAERHVVSDYVDHALATTAHGLSLPLDPAGIALLFDENPESTWSMLENLRNPLAVIRGAYSSFLREATVRQIRERVTVPLLTAVIPKAGHALPIERPDSLGKALDHAYQFVTDHAASVMRA
jgi:pimeloyl-ACP methyl ester carboxylesterase